jgi:hypothetical protein
MMRMGGTSGGPSPDDNHDRRRDLGPPLQGRAIAYEYDDRSFVRVSLHLVMAGLVPAIHAVRQAEDDVDARDKPGHDGKINRQDRVPGRLRIPYSIALASRGG